MSAAAAADAERPSPPIPIIPAAPPGAPRRRRPPPPLVPQRAQAPAGQSAPPVSPASPASPVSPASPTALAEGDLPSASVALAAAASTAVPARTAAAPADEVAPAPDAPEARRAEVRQAPDRPVVDLEEAAASAGAPAPQVVDAPAAPRQPQRGGVFPPEASEAAQAILQARRAQEAADLAAAQGDARAAYGMAPEKPKNRSGVLELHNSLFRLMGIQTDAEFVQKAYAQVLKRTPTALEYRHFLAQGEDKRSDLINTLLLMTGPKVVPMRTPNARIIENSEFGRIVPAARGHDPTAQQDDVYPSFQTDRRAFMGSPSLQPPDYSQVVAAAAAASSSTRRPDQHVGSQWALDEDGREADWGAREERGAQASQPSQQAASSHREQHAAAQEASLSARREVLRRQDAEYEESLSVDRQRRQQEEEEQAAKRAEAHKQQALAVEKEERIAALRQALPEEPSAEAAGRIEMVVRLPDGRRIRRAVLVSDPLDVLYNFVAVELNGALQANGFRLVGTMPRRTYANRSQTFADGGIEGPSVLMVEEV
eukprot:TRINITY_DN23881_c0_g1_i1.p1 TRINITY_DN23881_c0_g1~~TRINITY_DN23881_c0_g1_i1.p1  ORF type:complete len:541 (-),score=128.58 TRINITY_DN23881_c0_g1_i1:70-1692(-)